MRRNFNKHKRAEKQRRRHNHRLDAVIEHFTECKSSTGRIIRYVSGDRESSNWRCDRCGLRYILWSKTMEIQVKGFDRLPEDPTVLDLMTLRQTTRHQQDHQGPSLA